MFIIVIVISLEHGTGVRRYWFVLDVVVVVPMTCRCWMTLMHSIFRKFNRTQSVRYAQLRNTADS